MATQTATVPRIPFTAAAHEHVEPGEIITVTPGSSTQTFQINIPSYGYLRHIVLQVVGAGGTGGTNQGDAPWNLFSDITLLDVNGAPIFGPMDGYAAYLANVIGGYAFNQDPADDPWYSATAPNFAFALRVPVEISHFDALGSIANQNAAAPYRLSFTVNTTANVWSVAPSPLPEFTITPLIECWSLPNEVDVAGRPQEQLPPYHGTAQYWSNRVADTVAGNNTVQVTRVGNLIRNLIFVARNSSGVRQDNVFPDSILVNWDARQLFNETQKYRIKAMSERVVNWTRQTGVFVYSFNHSVMNRDGDETPNLWLPTVQSTRLEVNGQSAAAGTIQVIVNDIAPVETNPAERYVQRSETGFTPVVGTQAGAPVSR